MELLLEFGPSSDQNAVYPSNQEHDIRQLNIKFMLNRKSSDSDGSNQDHILFVSIFSNRNKKDMCLISNLACCRNLFCSLFQSRYLAKATYLYVTKPMRSLLSSTTRVQAIPWHHISWQFVLAAKYVIWAEKANASRLRLQFSCTSCPPLPQALPIDQHSIYVYYWLLRSHPLLEK